jgi:hypothetical protein
METRRIEQRRVADRDGSDVNFPDVHR